MNTNEQHLRLVLAACQAKRAADIRSYIKLSLAAFSFGTGIAFVWFLLWSILTIIM
jgi:hypothetical protein